MVSLLIVDDSDEIRRMPRTFVSAIADPIYECGDGGAACAAYAVHRPDWVLMDVSMLPMDGITATRQIVARFPAARIVILTQYDDARFTRAAQQAGACGYMLKNRPARGAAAAARREVAPPDVAPPGSTLVAHADGNRMHRARWNHAVLKAGREVRLNLSGFAYSLWQR